MENLSEFEVRTVGDILKLLTQVIISHSCLVQLETAGNEGTISIPVINCGFFFLRVL